MSVGARVNTCRLGSGSALAFLTMELGTLAGAEFTPFLKLNELVLREGRDGYWLSYPSKARMKNGEAVLKDGKQVYDDFYGPAFEDIDGKYSPTQASYRFKDYLTKLAGEAYEAALAEGAGRGAPRQQAAAPQQRSAPAPQRQAAPAPQQRSAPQRQPLVTRAASNSPALFSGEEAMDDLPF
jgi:hypothetical protein